MEEKKLHWRTGSKITHAGVEILPNGADIPRIMIDHLEFHEEAINVGGRSQTGVWEIVFEKNPYTEMRMVANSTNRKRLAHLFPECEGYISELRHVPVRLTKELTRDPSDGSQVYGLRISKIPAAPEQRKQLAMDKVDAVIKWAKGKKYGMPDVSKYYEMTAEVAEAVRKGLE